MLAPDQGVWHQALDDLVLGGNPAGAIWRVVDAPPGLAVVDGSLRQLALDPGAVAPGLYEVSLVAELSGQELGIRLELEILPAPALALRSAAPVSLLAGGWAYLDLGALVQGEDPGAVTWSVAGGLYVRAEVAPDGRTLVLDGSGAQPGREVFAAEARCRALRQTARIEVAISAPPLLLQPLPTATVCAGDTAIVDLSTAVAQPADAGQVSWSLAGPAGSAVWITPEGVLRAAVGADAAIEVVGRTRWGTAAATVVQVRVQPAAGPPVAPEPQPQPEPGAPAPLEPEVAAPVPGELAAATLTLDLPARVELVVGVPTRLVLADLLTGPGVAEVAWSIAAVGPGTARLEAGWLVLEGEADFHVDLVAVAPGGEMLAGGLAAHVAPPPDRLAPALGIEIRVDPAAGTALVVVSADEPLAAAPSVTANGAGLTVAALGGAYEAHLDPRRLEAPDGQVTVEARAQDTSGNAGRAVADLVAAVVRGQVAEVRSRDGALAVHLPPAATEALVWILRRDPGPAYYVGFDPGEVAWVDLRFESGLEAVERLGPAGWGPIPAGQVPGCGLWAVAGEPGEYRAVAGSAASVARPAVEVFPNPFN
ncbi:MAG: hypothetical protein ABIL09_09565, partial [Gemmatimonadota bacterium]